MASSEDLPAATGVVDWLLAGDSALQYQTWRDLLGRTRPELQQRAALDGDAAVILAARGDGGHWGRGFYQPKWTSSHYSLLELRDLAVAPDHPSCTATIALITREKAADGGVNPIGGVQRADVCINGMFLAYACYFGADPRELESVVDFILGQQLGDGGFNCHSNRSGARISSVHTTASVIDGFAEYLGTGYTRRAAEVTAAVAAASEALLDRRLYQRHGDGQPIRAELVRLHHPARWHFDVLRGLEVLRAAGASWEPRLSDALRVVDSRRRADGRWAAAAQYPGETHLAYSRAGAPNRWVTLRALRVLGHFRPPHPSGDA